MGDRVAEIEVNPTAADRMRQSISALAVWEGCSIGRLAGLGVDMDGIAGLITGGGGRMFGMVGRIGGTETIGMTTTGRGMETTTDGIATIVATTGTIPAGMIATMVAEIGGIAAKTTAGAGTMKEVAGMVAAGTGVIMPEAVMAEATGRAFRCKRGAWNPRLT